MFTQPFIGAQIKETIIKAQRHWALCAEFTGDRWIPRTNAQYRGNVSIWWRHHEFVSVSRIKITVRIPTWIPRREMRLTTEPTPRQYGCRGFVVMMHSWYVCILKWNLSAKSTNAPTDQSNEWIIKRQINRVYKWIRLLSICFIFHYLINAICLLSYCHSVDITETHSYFSSFRSQFISGTLSTETLRSKANLSQDKYIDFIGFFPVASLCYDSIPLVYYMTCSSSVTIQFIKVTS